MTNAVGFTRYQEDWPRRFAMAAHELSSVLGTAYSIEHIGSTAVPGLAAKDCVDTLVISPTRESLDGATTTISDAGYDFPAELIFR